MLEVIQRLVEHIGSNGGSVAIEKDTTYQGGQVSRVVEKFRASVLPRGLYPQGAQDHGQARIEQPSTPQRLTKGEGWVDGRGWTNGTFNQEQHFYPDDQG